MEAGVAALVAQRNNGHLLYRAVSRSYVGNAVAPHASSARKALTVTAGLAVDASVWACLRRTTDLRLGPRLVADALDAAVHGSRMAGTPEAAMLVGVPLAAETALRRGALAAVVPAVTLGATAFARRRRGLPTSWTAAMPQVQAVLLGAGVRAYLRRGRAQIVAHHEHEAEALVEQATIAGQLEVAMDGAALLDRLSAIGYVASVTGERPIGDERPLARWKASLAESAGQRNRFLRVVVCEWEREHRTPDLHDDVDLVIDEDTGGLLLTSAQAHQLRSALDVLARRGRLAVRRRPGPEPHLVGDPVLLAVGPHEVRLDADAVRGPSLDLAGGILAAGAGWVLALALPNHGDVPAAKAAGAAAASGLLAAVADRCTRSGAGMSPEAVVELALVVGAAQAIALGPTMRRPVDLDGVPVYAAALTLMAPAVLAGTYHGRLDRAARARVAVGFAAAVLASLATVREPVHPASLAAGVAELVAAYLLMAGVHGALGEDQAALDDALDARSRTLTEAAHEAGRHRTIALMRAERDRLVALVGEGAGDDLVSAEIRRRLDEVSLELEAWS